MGSKLTYYHVQSCAEDLAYITMVNCLHVLITPTAFSVSRRSQVIWWTKFSHFSPLNGGSDFILPPCHDGWGIFSMVGGSCESIHWPWLTMTPGASQDQMTNTLCVVHTRTQESLVTLRNRSIKHTYAKYMDTPGS